jgi:hypothetical protein
VWPRSPCEITCLYPDSPRRSPPQKTDCGRESHAILGLIITTRPALALQVAYLYTKVRSEFGKHCSFKDEPAKLIAIVPVGLQANGAALSTIGRLDDWLLVVGSFKSLAFTMLTLSHVHHATRGLSTTPQCTETSHRPRIPLSSWGRAAHSDVHSSGATPTHCASGPPVRAVRMP